MAGSEPRGQGWERRWEARPGESFFWAIEGVAEQLEALHARDGIPSGRALDLGCGTGAAASFLAGAGHPAVGVDISHSATVQAARATRTGATFAAADVTRLPFASSSFTFAFDRGCLHG